jgi:hypothetical protein
MSYGSAEEQNTIEAAGSVNEAADLMDHAPRWGERPNRYEQTSAYVNVLPVGHGAAVRLNFDGREEQVDLLTSRLRTTVVILFEQHEAAAVAALLEQAAKGVRDAMQEWR